MATCEKCGCYVYSDQYAHPKYCKQCAITEKLEYDRKRMQMKRKYDEELGTRNFGSKMKRNSDETPNFKAEKRAIRKELRELGLRK